MKQNIIENSGQFMLDIGDLLKSDEFLNVLKNYLVILNNKDKNIILGIFSKIEDNIELNKKDLKQLYFFISQIKKSNIRFLYKNDEFHKLENYIFAEFHSSVDGLINQIENHIFNLLNINSFENKDKILEAREFYGDIGIIKYFFEKEGFILGSRGISKFNKQTFELEKTTGDLGIGIIDYYFNYSIHNTISDQIKKPKKDFWLYGENGIAVINLSNLEIIHKTDDKISKVGKILKTENIDNCLYIFGNEGIAQLNKITLETIAVISYDEINNHELEIEDHDNIYDLEHYIEFIFDIREVSIKYFIENINLNEINKDDFKDIQPIEIIDLYVAIYNNISRENIEKFIGYSTEGDNDPEDSIIEDFALTEKGLTKKEALQYLTYIVNNIHNEEHTIGKRYKEFLKEKIRDFAKKNISHIPKEILSDINILIPYLEYYLDGDIEENDKEIQERDKDEDRQLPGITKNTYLSSAYGHRKGSIRQLIYYLGHNPFLESGLEKGQLERFTRDTLESYREAEYIRYFGNGIFYIYNFRKFVIFNSGKISIETEEYAREIGIRL